MDHEAVLRALGEEIRERRKTRGMSQEALAHKCELDRNVISMVERAVGNPEIRTLLRIADELGVVISELFVCALRRL